MLHRTPSWFLNAMLLFKACLRTLFSLLVVTGAAWWLFSQSWITAPFLESLVEDRPATALDNRRSFIVNVDLPANEQTLLTHSRGEFKFDTPLLLHSMGDESYARPVLTGETRVSRAVVVPDGSAVVVHGASGRVSRIELSVNVQIPLFVVPPQMELGDLAVSPDGRVVAVAVESEIVLCDALKGGERTRIPAGSAPISRLAYSDDGRRLAAGSHDGSLRIWNLGESVPFRVLSAHHGKVAQVQFFDEGRQVASVGLNDNMLHVMDVATGESLWRVAAGQAGLISLAISPDSRLAATAGLDNRICLWDLREKTLVRTRATPSTVTNVLRFTKNGSTLISTSENTIHFWDPNLTPLPREIDLEFLAPLAP